MKITSTYKKNAELDSEKPAIITDEECVLFGEWHDLVQRTATSFFREEACTKRVALFLPNGRLFLQLFAGACEAGWAGIVGDMRWKEEEIEARLQQTSPDLIIADKKLKGIFQNHRTKLIYSDEIENWIAKSYESHNNDADVPFYIGFTSGSTGNPKAFVRSQVSWVNSFRCNQVDLGMSEKDHVLIPGSFVNSTFLYGALSTLFLGGTIYVLKKYSPARLMNLVERYPISHVFVVPTMINSLLKEGYHENRAITFISTGAKWLPQMMEKMQLQFPRADFYEFYGSSELSYVSVWKKNDQIEYSDSVGRACHNVEVSIRDEKGQEVAVGEEGVLFVKSNMLFDGYIGQEEETKKVLQGEWATVYDVAKMNEKGYIHILGRKNDMILYGGINVYPHEIEQALMKCEGVEEVVVFGIKDEHWGEKIAACIKGNVSIPSLKNYCLQTLSSYKIPRVWHKVEQFPYTTGGKVSRLEVRNWFEKDE